MRLKIWLEEQDMSAYALAGLLGCSESHLSRVIAGERELGAKLRLEFLQRFGRQHYINVFGYNSDQPEVKIHQGLINE